MDEPGHPNYEEARNNAIRQLISATRDSNRFPLVFIENKAYGFARNLLGVRFVGIVLSAIALVVGVGLLLVADRVGIKGMGLGTAGAAAALAFWISYPTPHRVRAAGDDYADRLLEALDAGAL